MAKFPSHNKLPSERGKTCDKSSVPVKGKRLINGLVLVFWFQGHSLPNTVSENTPPLRKMKSGCIFSQLALRREHFFGSW